MTPTDPTHIIDGVSYTWRTIPGSGKDPIRKRMNFALLRRGKISLAQLSNNAGFGQKTQQANEAVSKKMEPKPLAIPQKKRPHASSPESSRNLGI